MHFHVDPENSRPTLSIVDMTVVAGRVTVVEANDAPHVIARAVPSSVNLNSIRSPSTGVPDRFVVIEVIAVPNPVKLMMSTLSVFVVGVAPGALAVVSRLVTLLFERVWVTDERLVPPTVYMFVDSTSVNHPLVTLAPVAAIDPVMVRLWAPNATVPLKVWIPVKVLAASVLAIVAEVVGNVMTVESVPDRVSEFVTANTFAFVIVIVPVEGVMVSPFMLVAVATPSTGVTRVGDVCNTAVEPDPVVVAAAMAVPFPERSGEFIVVLSVIAGVEVAVATLPANPFADTTDTDVTVPDPASVVKRA